MHCDANYRRGQLWEYAIVTSVSGVLFAFFQAVPQLHDPDSFYHIRLAWMMLHQGLIDQLPWLQYSFLAQQFTDQHLLYHMLLWPFFLMMNPIIGAKVLQALSIVILMMVLFHQLKRWRLPYALPAMLGLLSTTPFIIRLQLVKASVVAIVLFLLILFNLLERRYLRVMILSALYTWAHGGFILAFILAMVVWVSEIVVTLFRRGKWCWISLQPALLVVIALVIGAVVNPYFPNSMYFYWQQLVHIGVVNYQDTITVGAEWYPFAVPDFISVLSILFIGVVGAVAVSVYQRSVQVRDVTAVSLGVLVILFIIATLRSRRYIEYLTPLAWLWSCYTVLPYLASEQWKKLQYNLQQQLGGVYRVLVIYFMLTIPSGLVLAVVKAYHVMTNGISLHTLQSASEFLRDHVPEHTVVFHGNWDEWPMLFFHNPSEYYIIGLDPTFMYLFDREKYQQWLDVASGKSKQQSAHDIRQWFDSRYVVIQRQTDRTKLLQAYLLRDPTVRVLYQDASSVVFELL